VEARTTTLVQKVFIEGRIEDVWREVTRTDRLQKGVFNMRLHSDLKVGSPIRMRTSSGKYTVVVGEVLALEPPHRFSHTFRFTRYDDPPCRVTYELREVQGGVDFTLRVDDLAAGTKTAKDMGGGASFICNNIKSIVEKGDVAGWVRLVYGLVGLLEPLVSPGKSKSEHWG
jgi:uncharacterized protein YndB with AHSA1/START domain